MLRFGYEQARDVEPVWDPELGIYTKLLPGPVRSYLTVGFRLRVPHWFLRTLRLA